MINKRTEKILKLIKNGYTIKDIANQFQISTHTIKSYIAKFKHDKKIEFLFHKKP